ncbi:DUF2254 domain-containing protein [Acidovorax sp. Root217]|uniref:DUF2254 domain-containing protein n=1 Tax=Acidovorax sp. Root217 TaxID=1736492 RepID=UPI00070C92D9|nr:DUF2254 domain-containing protein [Acidovorax sp. Root217]KRC17807.1 formate C-acetyltransferase glycine radical [Acidovorax sp. Root217]
MKARFRQFLSALGDSFWLLPAALVVLGIVLAFGLLRLDRSDLLPAWLIGSTWIYNGGGTGARTLLGVIASSAIGVAGTVFSITIAALSLAAGQMGPRLLHNFTRDRGVQITLGAFLGTFSYALMVLRSVRTQEEGPFTPHLALTFGIVLALACVGTLVYFVAHMAGRINVDTVVNLVSEDVRSAVQGVLADEPPAQVPPGDFWAQATPVVDARQGYLQQLDETKLADWASQHGTAIRLLVRPGDYVFPGAPIALMTVHVPGAEAAIRDATALGNTRSGGNAEYAIRQLVEVAVRALSPGINDPNTAMSVLDRLGAALCDIAGHHLPSGVSTRGDSVVLVVPDIGYAGLVNVMFHMIRQSAAANAAVLIKLLDVLTAVVVCESATDRKESLAHHAELVWADARRQLGNRSDRQDVHRRYRSFRSAAAYGVLGAVGVKTEHSEIRI